MKASKLKIARESARVFKTVVPIPHCNWTVVHNLKAKSLRKYLTWSENDNRHIYQIFRMIRTLLSLNAKPIFIHLWATRLIAFFIKPIFWKPTTKRTSMRWNNISVVTAKVNCSTRESFSPFFMLGKSEIGFPNVFVTIWRQLKMILIFLSNDPFAFDLDSFALTTPFLSFRRNQDK